MNAFNRILCRLLLALSILAGCLLVAIVCLILFLPWGTYETDLKRYLNEKLPVTVEFTGLTASWKNGLGISIENVSISEGPDAGGQTPVFSAPEIFFNASLMPLLNRRLNLSLHFVSPDIQILSNKMKSVETDTSSDGSPALKRKPDSPFVVNDILSSIPGGFQLSRFTVGMNNGTIDILSTEKEDSHPVRSISKLSASARLEKDLSFHVAIDQGVIRWGFNEPTPLTLSGRCAGEANGRFLPGGDVGAALPIISVRGNIELHQPDFTFMENHLALPDRIAVTFDAENQNNGKISVNNIKLEAPAVEMATKAEIETIRSPEWRLKEVRLSELGLRFSDWNLIRPFLPAGMELSGKLSANAQSLRITPGEEMFPSIRNGSFRLEMPSGLFFEDVRLDVSQGNVVYPLAQGPDMIIKGLEMSLKQGKGNEWSGIIVADHFEAVPDTIVKRDAPEDDGSSLDGSKQLSSSGDHPKDSLPYHIQGPLLIESKLVDNPEGAAIFLKADVTGCRMHFQEFFDKPEDVPMGIGLRAFMGRDKVKIEKAYFQLDQVKLFAAGSVKERKAPVVMAKLMTDAISLDHLAAVSPFLRKQDVHGRLEIKSGLFKGNLGSFVQTTVAKLQMEGKNLKWNSINIKEMNLHAFYDNQTLFFDSLRLEPGQGAVQADIGIKLPDTLKDLHDYEYSGKLKATDTSINEMVSLIRPASKDSVYGKLRTNLIFRGRGIRLNDVKKNLDALGRIYLDNVVLPEKDEEQKTYISEGLRNMFGSIIPDAFANPESVPLTPEQASLVSTNRVSAEFRVHEGILSTKDLVGNYDGKIIKMQGDIGMAGRLEYSGKLFFGNRMIPFQRECHIGKDGCMPMPNLKEMTISGAKEFYGAARNLSTASVKVFEKLLF